MRRISVKASVNKVGRWSDAMNASNHVSIAAERALDEFAKNVGERAVRQARYYINSQSLGWAQLSEKTVKYKRRKKGARPTAAWYFRGEMYKSIYANYAKASKYVFIGVKPTLHPDSKTSLVQLAKMLETGSDKIPARPLFSPTRDFIYKTIKSGASRKLDPLVLTRRHLRALQKNK